MSLVCLVEENEVENYYFLVQNIFQHKIWDRIKGLILRRINAYCGAAATRGAAAHNILYIAAAVHEPQYMRDKRVSCVLWRHSIRAVAAGACRGS